MKKPITIGNLAKATGIPKGSLRYYEAIGLIPEPQRSESGYRLYSDAHVRKAQLIKQAKHLGLNLQEIDKLLNWASRDACHPFRQHLVELVDMKIGELDARIGELKSFKRKLKRLHACLGISPGQIQKEEIPVLESSNCFCLDVISRLSSLEERR